jgi:NADPH2:quinone reductase
MTLGTDAVGIVVTLPKVQMVATSLPPLKIGQRVLTCESAAFAEYMVAPWWQVAPLPDEIDPKSAVAMATSLFTAMYLVRESYQVTKGDWVLVRAAAGGVGLFLCQVRRFGTGCRPRSSSTDGLSSADTTGHMRSAQPQVNPRPLSPKRTVPSMFF